MPTDLRILARAAPRRSGILGLLVAFAFVGYMQRAGVSIAAEQMMPSLGLSQVQVGWLMTVFLIGYTAFQFPGAVIGELLGVRVAITLVGLLSVAATVATCLAPSVGMAIAVFPLLLLSRLVLGVAQAALFPVSSGAIETWFPASAWAFAQGWVVFGMWIGSAVAGPAIVWLMEQRSWQFALYLTSVPSLVLVGVWYLYARHPPALSVRAASDGAIDKAAPASLRLDSRLFWQGLRRNSLLLRVTLSYFLTNYVFYLVTFWSFLYLVQDKHFSTLQSGWLAGIPFLAAAIAAPTGGKITESLCGRYGDRTGYRLVPLIALPLGAVRLYFTVTAADPYWAVAALSSAFGCVELTEGAYWSAAMRSAPADSMVTTAVLNTGGNLGGIVATPIIAALSAASSWTSVFATGALLSVAAAALWFWVDVTQQHAPTPDAPLLAN